MFPLGSTPSKRPKRRVESYRILYAHILHALSLPGHPLRVTEKATHGEQVGLYSLHSWMGTSITVNIVPKCEVCPRDHGKVVESHRGESGFDNILSNVVHENFVCDNRSLMESVDITHKHGQICDHMLVPVRLSHNGCVAEMKWHCRNQHVIR